MDDRRYRPRHRTNPLVPLVGILVLVLLTGGVVVVGGSFAAKALLSATAATGTPDASPSTAPRAATDADPTASPHPTRRPHRTPVASAAPDSGAVADPTRRPRGDAGGTTDPSPEPSLLADAIDTIAVDGDTEASPAPARTPRPWSDLRPRPRPGPFSMDIYKPGTMASEALPQWCVPAAMLTMINLMKKGRPDTSDAEQKRLYYLARHHSTDKLTGAGAEPEGWAGGLNAEGYGPYRVYIADNRLYAIRQAARALRLTGRPVGLLAWRGAHSWVMTGFEATADPAYTNKFVVTGVYIADVWYPRVSTIWGPSNPPDTLVPFDKLPIDYLEWRRPDVKYPDKDGKFIVVLPVRDDGRYDPTAD
ncbi:MAG: hypothetical protein U0869_02265 [Chloroflexota bacterium]